MKNLNHFFAISLAIILIVACKKQSKDIVKIKDITPYLAIQPNAELDRIHQNINFWTQKLQQTPNQFPYKVQLAGLQNQLFAKTGNIAHLKQAEFLLQKAVAKSGETQSGYLRALAKNYISQHQFQKAFKLLQTAILNGDKKQETIKMLFDVSLELGQTQQAENYLHQIQNKRSFDYLIRLAKWNDYNGNLDATIAYMEEALAIVKAKEHKDLELWCITNLADYYGHHGDIQKSYDYYLKALSQAPQNFYALKKIAWIAYAHDKDVQKAKTILAFLNTHYDGIDVDLLAYEIASYEQKDTKETLDAYWSQVQNPQYGAMYNAYNFDILMELQEYNAAYQLAKEEVENRPTPASYAMLALASCYTEAPTTGLQIIEQHKVTQSYEPKVWLNVAKVYAKNKQTEALEPIKKELLSAAFELGPLAVREIQKL